MVNKVDKLVWNDKMMLNLMDYYSLVANEYLMLIMVELLYSMIDDDMEHIVEQEKVRVEWLKYVVLLNDDMIRNNTVNVIDDYYNNQLVLHVD